MIIELAKSGDYLDQVISVTHFEVGREIAGNLVQIQPILDGAGEYTGWTKSGVLMLSGGKGSAIGVPIVNLKTLFFKNSFINIRKMKKKNELVPNYEYKIFVIIVKYSKTYAEVLLLSKAQNGI